MGACHALHRCHGKRLIPAAGRAIEYSLGSRCVLRVEGPWGALRSDPWGTDLTGVGFDRISGQDIQSEDHQHAKWPCVARGEGEQEDGALPDLSISLAWNLNNACVVSFAAVGVPSSDSCFFCLPPCAGEIVPTRRPQADGNMPPLGSCCGQSLRVRRPASRKHSTARRERASVSSGRNCW